MAEKRIMSLDPITEVAIAGGKCLPPDEQGDLDTDVDIRDPLYDRRLEIPLDEPFVRNVDAFGVHTPTKGTKRNGVVFLVIGRRRLRAARKTNRRRIATGQPPMRIDVAVEVSKDETRLMGLMYGENANRMGDDFASTVENVHRYMGRGVSLEDAATTFGLEPAKAKAWLDFDTNAIDVVRDYVHRDIMSVSAGIEIMRAGDADAQRAALVALLEDVGLIDVEAGDLAEGEAGAVKANASRFDNQKLIDEASAKIAAVGDDAKAGAKAVTKTGKAAAKISARNARNAAKSVTRPNAQLGVPDRKTQTRLLQALRDKAHNLKAQRTVDFFEGAENMLTLILGGDEAKETDPRLVELLKEVRKAMKAAK